MYNRSKAIASALTVNAVLKCLDMRYNNLGSEGEQVLRDAVKDRSDFQLLVYLKPLGLGGKPRS